MAKFIFWSICGFGSLLFLIVFLVCSLIQSIDVAEIIVLIASVTAFIAFLILWIKSFKKYRENPNHFKFD